MWLVAVTSDYEHGVSIHKTYEEAKAEYDKDVEYTLKYKGDNRKVYIAEIMEEFK